MSGNKLATLSAALLNIFLIIACGNAIDPKGEQRGLLGQEYNDFTSTNTTVQSSTGLSCTATPTQAIVGSGKPATVSITVNGATGAVSIYDTNIQKVSNQTQFSITTSFTTQRGNSVTITPSVIVQDSTGTATCYYRITIQ